MPLVDAQTGQCTRCGFIADTVTAMIEHLRGVHAVTAMPVDIENGWAWARFAINTKEGQARMKREHCRQSHVVGGYRHRGFLTKAAVYPCCGLKVQQWSYWSELKRLFRGPKGGKI